MPYTQSQKQFLAQCKNQLRLVNTEAAFRAIKSLHDSLNQLDMGDDDKRYFIGVRNVVKQYAAVRLGTAIENNQLQAIVVLLEQAKDKDLVRVYLFALAQYVEYFGEIRLHRTSQPASMLPLPEQPPCRTAISSRQTDPPNKVGNSGLSQNELPCDASVIPSEVQAPLDERDAYQGKLTEFISQNLQQPPTNGALGDNTSAHENVDSKLDRSIDNLLSSSTKPATLRALAAQPKSESREPATNDPIECTASQLSTIATGLHTRSLVYPSVPNYSQEPVDLEKIRTVATRKFEEKTTLDKPVPPMQLRTKTLFSGNDPMSTNAARLNYKVPAQPMSKDELVHQQLQDLREFEARNKAILLLHNWDGSACYQFRDHSVPERPAKPRESPQHNRIQTRQIEDQGLRFTVIV